MAVDRLEMNILWEDFSVQVTGHTKSVLTVMERAKIYFHVCLVAAK